MRQQQHNRFGTGAHFFIGGVFSSLSNERMSPVLFILPMSTGRQHVVYNASAVALPFEHLIPAACYNPLCTALAVPFPNPESKDRCRWSTMPIFRRAVIIQPLYTLTLPPFHYITPVKTWNNKPLFTHSGTLEYASTHSKNY